MGDEDAGAPGEQPVGGPRTTRPRSRVHPRRRFVEHHDRDVADQQPGEGDELLLARRQRLPPVPSRVPRPVGKDCTHSVSPSSATAPSTSARRTSLKRVMFSASVAARISVRCVTTPTARPQRLDRRRRDVLPATNTVPGGGSTARDSSLASVDLPEPVRPTSAQVVPAATERSTEPGRSPPGSRRSGRRNSTAAGPAGTGAPPAGSWGRTAARRAAAARPGRPAPPAGGR